MPSKSFRVAAERIVRQESASPTDVLSLLGSPTEPWRAIASEIDEWDARRGALRAGGGFTAADAARAAALSTVLALEVPRAAVAMQDTRTRQQALGLFELARVGLAELDLAERLPLMVEVLAKSFRHDVAQVWMLRGGASLRLRAAHPHEALVLEIARPRDHAPFARALDGDV